MITLPVMSMVNLEYKGQSVEAEVVRRRGFVLHVFALPDGSGWRALDTGSGSEGVGHDRASAIAAGLLAAEAADGTPSLDEAAAHLLDGIEDENVMPAAEAIKILTQRISVLEAHLHVAVCGHENITRELSDAKRKLASYRRLHDSRN